MILRSSFKDVESQTIDIAQILSVQALITLDNLVDRAGDLVRPTMRFGVTGLSRSGKTVFITALIHNLLHGGRLPLFKAQHDGRISSAYLEPQPDDGVPRFQYEDHVAALVNDRIWPQSTRAISELRLTIEYESASAWGRLFSSGKMSIDIVDYPGEWLLDLPLMQQDYRTFSSNAIDLANSPARADLAQKWLSEAARHDLNAPAEETTARDLAALFADYLKACRSDERALSTLPPGRFLMPGDLEGSPALTFCPMPSVPDGPAPNGSLWAMMERRYEAYKSLVVKPFFRDHFARLDRQIILIDAMHALNAGPDAVQDLEQALVDILSCFRAGRGNSVTSWFSRRIDRVLVAVSSDTYSYELRRHPVLRGLRDLGGVRPPNRGAKILPVQALSFVRSSSRSRSRYERPLMLST